MGEQGGGEEGQGQPADDLAALGRELRDAVGDEFRAEAEENERVAAQARLRKRSLTDVARELLQRGDEVQIGVGTGASGVRFTGRITHAAGDLVTVVTPGATVHVRMASPAFVRVAGPSSSPGAEITPGPETFKARLFELELGARAVRLGCPLLGDEVTVRIEAVATDHVVIVDGDGARWHLPLDAVLYVAEPTDGR